MEIFSTAYGVPRSSERVYKGQRLREKEPFDRFDVSRKLGENSKVARSSAAHCQLPTAHCLLLTVGCRLSTVGCPPTPVSGQEVIVKILSGSDFSGYWIITISLPYGFLSYDD